MVEVLPDEPRPGGFMRALVGGRPAVTAFTAGIAGAGAFVVSLLADWQTVTTPERMFGDSSVTEGDSLQLTAGLDLASYALAYLLGVLGLLALLGSVVARPDFAQRMRMPAAGLGLGVVGVLVGIVYQVRDAMDDRLFGFGAGLEGFPQPQGTQDLVDETVYGMGPGVYVAAGAVVALVAGVWLAAGPIRGGALTGAAAAPGYVLVPAYPLTAAAGTGMPAGPGFLPVAAPQGPSIPISAAPVSPADPALADPAAAPVSPTPVGPPGLPPDRPSGGPAWPPSRAGYADGLTVTSSDAIDPGTQADILRS
jgi:hypothetical protein